MKSKYVKHICLISSQNNQQRALLVLWPVYLFYSFNRINLVLPLQNYIGGWWLILDLLACYLQLFLGQLILESLMKRVTPIPVSLFMRIKFQIRLERLPTDPIDYILNQYAVQLVVSVFQSHHILLLFIMNSLTVYGVCPSQPRCTRTQSNQQRALLAC